MTTKTNTSRDLMLLAAVAYSKGQYDSAGTLFAASLSSEDVGDLVDCLETMCDTEARPAGKVTASAELAASQLPTSMSISDIAKSLSAAMEEHDEDNEEDTDELPEEDAEEDEVESEAEPEEDQEEDEEDTEDMDEEAESDDPDPSCPGQSITPSSVSSSSEVEMPKPRSRPVIVADEDTADTDEATSSDEARVSFVTTGASPVSLG